MVLVVLPLEALLNTAVNPAAWNWAPGPVVLNTKAMLLKKDILKETGLFDIGLGECEGLDLTYRLLHNGFHIVSTVWAKSYWIGQRGTLFSFFLRSLVRGYFEARVLQKYNVPIGKIFRGLKLSLLSVGFDSCRDEIC